MDMPSDLSEPKQALWWLQAGALSLGPDWLRAHEICQLQEGTRDYDLVHALCHWIEGDLGNRDYWLRRAGAWLPAASVAEEWQAVSDAVS